MNYDDPISRRKRVQEQIETIAGRKRVRSYGMAAELEVSIRKFRELVTLGMPYTQVQGVQWFEPDKVHKWLDKFNRTGVPGIKRVKGIKIAEASNK